jgi:hypothetical protein
MDAEADTAQYIESRKLTTWAVLPGGDQVCLGFAAADGGTHRIVLPFEALTGLLMTLPRMMQSALNERFPDGSLRIVHPLALWRLEQAEGDNGLILKLATRDGFEVAFAIPDEDAGSLGTALLGAPGDLTLTLTRKPN